jgi:guanosine-3',5'-bis(diphosphate) 3'-pyrophosphohydrolase
MQDWVRVLTAANAAATWHVHQRRKGAAAEPYINHVLEVASLVAEATGGSDPNLVIAALLHDVVEDCGVSAETLQEQYGPDVAALVAEVTDDKQLPKAERKRLQVEKASGKSLRAKIIKLADKTSNLRALATSPPSDWPKARKIEYLTWARQVAAGLRGANPKLECYFDEAARDLEACHARP